MFRIAATLAATFLTQAVFAGQIPLGKIACMITELKDIEVKDGQLIKNDKSGRDWRQAGDKYDIEYGIESTKKTIYVKVGDSLLDKLEAKGIKHLAPNEILLRDPLGAHWGEFSLGKYDLNISFPKRNLYLAGYEIDDRLKTTRFSGIEVKHTQGRLEYRVLDCTQVQNGYRDLWDYTQ